MKRILVIDDNSKWVQLCLELGYITIGQIEPEDLKKTNYDLYAVSDTQPLNLFEALQGKSFVITTSSPNVPKAIDAFRIGAMAYMAKDSNQDIIRKKINELL